MAYWLMKSEPGAYSWDDLVRDGSTYWDGVRNYQAANNMKKMKKGEKIFFYHSVTEKQIVGVMEVTREYYFRSPLKFFNTSVFDVPKAITDKLFFNNFAIKCLPIKPLAPVTRFVTLAQIKSESKLADLALIRQSRLSVLPIAATHWKILCKMAGMKA